MSFPAACRSPALRLLDADRGGADAFLRYREVADYYGWVWTFWTYKAVNDNHDVNGGLQGYYDERPRPDINHDSLDAIRLSFTRFDSAYSMTHPLIQSALSAPVR